MDINFAKEQFEIAKKTSHLSETIVIDVKTAEWLIEQAEMVEKLKAHHMEVKGFIDTNTELVKENERWKERNSRYAKSIEWLKSEKIALEIDCKFKYYTTKRYEEVLEQIASGKKGNMDVNRIWLMRMAEEALK